MNMTSARITLLVVFTVILLASQAISGSKSTHLQPEEGIFGFTMLNPYYEAVSERLLSTFQGRKCQAVFLPSFLQESAVYLKYDSSSSTSQPVVVALKMEEQLWAEMHRAIDGDAGARGTHPMDAETQRRALLQIRSVVNRLEAPLDKKVAEALEHTWDAMLMRVHYPEGAEHGLDGETCHFANFVLGVGYRAGKVWSPAEGTLTYELVELAKALREYPGLREAERNSAAQEMLNRAQKILTQLEGSK